MDSSRNRIYEEIIGLDPITECAIVKWTKAP